MCCYIHKYLWQSSDSVLIQAGQFNTASDEHEGGGSRPALSLCPEDLVLLSFFHFTRRNRRDQNKIEEIKTFEKVIILAANGTCIFHIKPHLFKIFYANGHISFKHTTVAIKRDSPLQ